MNPARLRIAVFASGTGTNLTAIIEAIRRGRLAAEIAFVLASRADAGALARARDAGIPAYHVPEATRPDPAERDREILDLLGSHGVGLVALAGYLKRLSPGLLAAFGRPVLNIHPALLPAFGGQGMYGRRVFEAVLAHGVKLSGVTVHLVDEDYDHGPIVCQEAIPVLDDDTPETLAERTHAVEHRLYPTVLQWFATGRAKVEGRRVRILPVAPGG